MFVKVMVAAAATAAVSAQTKTNTTCMTKHCLKEMEKTATTPQFWEMAGCQKGCNKVWDEDMTPEKLEYQNCTTTCALTYDSPQSDAFTGCIMKNNCIEFPAIPGSCPNPEVSATLSLADLSGEWWQHRGKNALWDCYPCQHIHSMFLVDDQDWCGQTVRPGLGPVQAPCWNYSYSYDLYIKDKHAPGGTTTTYFGQSWQLPGNTPTGNRIDIYYQYMGSLHNESWFLLDAKPDKYVLLVDCSYMNTWTNVGSIVWVRPGYELTKEDDVRIAQVYKDKLGWDYNDFCYDRHGPEHCDGPAERKQVPISERRPTPPHFKYPVYTPQLIDEMQKLISH